MAKIIFIVGSFRQGGFERRISEFVEWIDHREIDTEFSVICQSLKGIHRPNISRDKIIYWPFHLLHKLHLFKLEKLATYWRLKSSVPFGKKLILFIGHQAILKNIIENEFIKFDKSISIVFNLVNNLEFSPYKKSIYKNLNDCSVIICNSQENSFLMRQAFVDKVSYVPNYYKRIVNESFSCFAKKRSGKIFKIVSCGSLTKQKGFDYLIGAMSLLAFRGFEVHLTIFGSGVMKNSLCAFANRKGLKNFEIIEGEDFKLHRTDYDIFACSSLFEGYPNALLEAQIGGLPAVAFNCQFGPSEIIVDQYSGILVKDFSTVSLAQGLEDVIRNYEYFSAHMTEHSKRLVEKHSEENSIEKLFNILLGL